MKFDSAAFKALAFFFAALFLGLFFLYRAHPFEDAFILFKYAENIAAGRGVVFYAGGPHAEGYVDFLWVCLIALLRFFGADVAAAAALLNAIGAAAAFYVMASNRKTPHGLLFQLFPLIILISPCALAGYGGFSTLFYCGAILACAGIYLSVNPDRTPLLPPLLLVTALIRADGLIVAAVYFMLGAFKVRKTSQQTAYWKSSIVCLLAGLLYWTWRRVYFGKLLPLPLYVKSTGPLWKGWPLNEAWLLDLYQGPLLWLAAFLILLLIIRKAQGAETRRLLLNLIPVLILFLSLAVASQWQNEFMRFQAPFWMMLAYSVFRAGALAWSSSNSKKIRGLTACLLLIPALAYARFGASELKRLIFYEGNYLDAFAPALGKHLGPENRILLTEAGRIPYWSSAAVYDAHGLNTPEVSGAPPRLEALRDFAPDIILFQHAGTFQMPPVSEIPGALLPVSGPLAHWLKEEYWPAYADLVTDYKLSLMDRGIIVPVILTKFIDDHRTDYEVFMRLYQSRHRSLGFWHVYALKKNWAGADFVRQLLSTPYGQKDRMSYAQLKKFWFTGR